LKSESEARPEGSDANVPDEGDEADEGDDLAEALRMSYLLAEQEQQIRGRRPDEEGEDQVGKNRPDWTQKFSLMLLKDY